MKQNNYRVSMGFPQGLTLLFIGLKLTDYIAWSWWWVLSPVLISSLLLMLVIIIGEAYTRGKKN